MPAIRSSAISFADYNAKTRELVITFAKGNFYTYFGVPPELYEKFIASDSKGKFFNLYIKDRFLGM